MGTTQADVLCLCMCLPLDGSVVSVTDRNAIGGSCISWLSAHYSFSMCRLLTIYSTEFDYSQSNTDSWFFYIWKVPLFKNERLQCRRPVVESHLYIE